MGLFRFFKSQFTEVIEWTDQNANTMVYRFPVQNNEIKMGAKLTVRVSNPLVFLKELLGTIASYDTSSIIGSIIKQIVDFFWSTCNNRSNSSTYRR